MVDLDRLSKLGEELRTSIPSDIQEAEEILRQKDSIINQAQLESRRVKEIAEQEGENLKMRSQQEHEVMVSESEVVKIAQMKAEEINQEALQDAQQVVQDAQGRAYRITTEAEAIATARRDGADQYARESLFNLEERLSEQLGQVRRGIDVLGLEADVGIPA